VKNAKQTRNLPITETSDYRKNLTTVSVSLTQLV